jgi:hypothetical protein
MARQIVWSPGITLADIEKEVIYTCLRYCDNNKTATALALGISVRGLDNKLALYKQQEESLFGNVNKTKRKKRNSKKNKINAIVTTALEKPCL